MTKKETTPVQTLVGTNGTYTTKQINGKILSLKIMVDASITITAHTTGCPISEYIFGANGAPITVASTSVFYPRVEGHLASTGAALAAENKTNVFQEIAISGTVTFTVVGTNTKLWQVEVIYEN
jgi:hypothetical protein